MPSYLGEIQKFCQFFRRTVCFSEAIRLGEMTVEDISARKAETPEEALTLAQSGVVAVLADPAGACIPTLRPGAVVDAILAKKNLGTALTDAPVVIGVGPGFTVGTDCHAAVETMRGHTLGRALYTGSPLPNTGIPGLIADIMYIVIFKKHLACHICK